MNARDLRLQVILNAIDRASGPLKAITAGGKGMSAAVKAARDSLRALEAQGRQIDSFRKVSRDVAVTGNTLELARGKVAALAREMKATDAPSKALTRNFEAARREAHQLRERHQALTVQQQRLRTELQAAGVPLKGLAQHQAELRTRTTAATDALARQTAALRAQAEHTGRLNAARERYDRTLDARNRIAGAGAAALGAGGGVLYGAARFVQPGIEFDKTMSKVQALARLDKDSEQMRVLREQARHLGAVTMFSATDAAQGQAFLAMAGFTPEAIRAAMPGLLDAALAGDTDLGRTADIASNILSQFNIDPGRMGEVSDVLVAAFTQSNTTLEMLGETMKYAGTVAEGLSYDLETTAAMAGILGGAGLQGGMAGTSLRAIMSRLAAPPKMAREALEDLGIQAADSAGNMRPVADVLAEIHQKTLNLGNAQRSGYLKAIAGEEASAGLNYLVGKAGGGELQTFIQTLRDSAGEASKVAKKMADNLTGDLDELSSGWEDLQITLFETNNGAMRDTVKWITEIVGQVGAWAAANPGLVSALSKIAIGTAFVVAAFGGLALALAAVIGPFAVMRYGMALFGIQGARLGGALWSLARGALPALATGLRIVLGLLIANPIGATIAALALGAYLVWRNWDTVAATFGRIWSEIRAAFAGGLGAVGALIINWSPVGLFYGAMAGVLSYFGIELPGKFTEFGGMLIDGLVRGITGTLGRARDAITGAGDSVVGWFKEKLGIRSPSRVFAELGGFTMQGLAQGLQRTAGAPLDVLTRAARALTVAAGTGMAGVGVAMAGGADIPIDSRPPLAARAAGGGQVSSHYEIHIHAAPGMDPQQVARAVAAELDRRDRDAAARRRSRLADDE
ncbi:phage tail tape measure protein [Thauera butanivorans]|uniref:phage tail tape measure protein n=1 Tax=Thauera butanivorans TaxID=86174 RepID=UPI000837D590|nr:phage tail tape measure protein [Thauera butanivorans]